MKKLSGYKKELYSIPISISEELQQFAKEENMKKSHIVALALKEYLEKNRKSQRIEDALSLIGLVASGNSDIQEIKANR